MRVDEEDVRDYIVLVNHEEQYSLWFKGSEIPKGWIATGAQGCKADCLKYVAETWTDMTPRSLRKDPIRTQ